MPLSIEKRTRRLLIRPYMGTQVCRAFHPLQPCVLISPIGGIAMSWPPEIAEYNAPLLDSLERVGIPRKPDNVRDHCVVL